MGLYTAKSVGATPATPPAGFLRLYNDGTSWKYVNSSGTVFTLSTGVTAEEVQDIVGAFFADSASIDVTYNDAGDVISAVVLASGVNHNLLQNYVANQHVDHTTVSISAGTGLSGGGDISANRTISMPNVGTAGTYGSASQVPVVTTDAQGRISGAVNTAISILAAAVTDFASNVRNTVLTGLSLVNSAVTSADTVLSAIGKLQGQINALSLVGDPWTYLRKTALSSNTSNVTFVNLADLGISCVAGSTYYIEMSILGRSSAAATGLGFALATPDTAVGTLACTLSAMSGGDGTGGLYSGAMTSLGDLVLATAVPAANTYYVYRIEGVFICTVSGTLLPQFRSETNGNNVDVGPGSIASYRVFT